MLLFVKLFLSVLTFSAAPVAKKPHALDTKNHYPLFINYYPSALVARDISFGLEKKLFQNFSLETTIAWHSLSKPIDYYQQGGRCDLLPKYAFITKAKFEWTVVSDLFFLYYFSRDTWFDQQIVLLARNQQAAGPSYRTKENKSLKSLGMGLGFGFRYFITRRFSICSENFLSYSKIIRQQTITQLEYLTNNSGDYSVAPNLGSTSLEFPMRLGFRSTLKICYVLDFDRH